MTATVAKRSKSWGGKGDSDRRREAEEVMRLRTGGQSFYEIAQQLSISERTARTRFKAALDERMPETIETWRKTVLEKYDRQYLALERIVQSERESARTKVEAVSAQTRLTTELRKLLALDTPVVQQVQVTVSDGTVDDEMQRLAEELGLNDPLTQGNEARA